LISCIAVLVIAGILKYITPVNGKGLKAETVLEVISGKCHIKGMWLILFNLK
jgi:hypothetical protein